MLKTLKTLFARPARPVVNARLSLDVLETREVPASIGWLKGAPQFEPPAVTATVVPINWAATGVPPNWTPFASPPVKAVPAGNAILFPVFVGW